jgi:CheY-like chemotaxis protein
MNSFPNGLPEHKRGCQSRDFRVQGNIPNFVKKFTSTLLGIRVPAALDVQGESLARSLGEKAFAERIAGMAKILVVDDDPDVVDVARMVLEKEGHEVASAGSREEGMTAVEEAQPDLLVLDCMMVEANDGLVMARDLRKAGFTKPILMLSNINMITGMTLDKDEEILPVDEFQEKPVEPEVFIAKVNNLLNR